MFELLKQGEILQIPTENPMTEKQAWSAFRDIIHGLEYRKNYFQFLAESEIRAHLQNSYQRGFKEHQISTTINVNYLFHIYQVFS